MNFHDFLDNQLTEDRRAFIVHYPAKSGKTAFFRDVESARDDVQVLDLQKWLLKHDKYKEISSVDSSGLEKIILGLDFEEPVIIVDNCDVLFNTWKDADKDRFASLLKVKLRSPGVTDKTFVFVIQTDPFFDQTNLTNSQDKSRIIPLDAFNLS